VIVPEEPEVIAYKPRGAARALFADHRGKHGWPLEDYDEVLFEGVAGGGKSLAYAHFVHWACCNFPGLQVLMVRKYRDSMSQSCMKTYEEEVLKRHMPQICDGRDRTQRSHYEYPEAFNAFCGQNGTSRVVMCGITDEEKIRSTAWNIVWLNEGTEIALAHYETLLSRLRPAGVQVAPYNLILVDCNPSFKGHWLNKRFSQDGGELKRLRLITKHTDNPTYWDEVKGEWTEIGRKYMAKLRSNTGARYKRLYKGLWCSEEGLVYDEFDPEYHIIGANEVPPIEYYVASYDPSPSSRNASVMQVWGIDAEERGYMVAEAHMVGKGIDWWAETALKFYQRYRPRQIVCDPSNPGMIELFNNRIGARYGNFAARVAVKANNDVEAGIAQVKSALTRERHLKTCPPNCERPENHGKARIYFVETALTEYDPEKEGEEGRSKCTTDELMQLSWKIVKDGQEAKSEWDSSIPHDGCDCVRYFAMFNERRGLGTRRMRTMNPYKPGSPAYVMWQEGRRGLTPRSA